MTDAVAEEKLKVFISYLRRDSAALADELVGDLRLLASHRSSIVTTCRRGLGGASRWLDRGIRDGCIRCCAGSGQVGTLCLGSRSDDSAVETAVAGYLQG